MEISSICDPLHVRTPLVWLLAIGVGLLTAAPLRAQVEQWVDEQGVTHYTIGQDGVPALPDGPPARATEPTSAPGAVDVYALPPPAPRGPTPPPESTDGSRAADLYALPPPAPRDAPPQPPAQQPAILALPPPAFEDAPADSPQHTAVQQLEEQIARDQEELKRLISDPSRQASQLATDERLREIATRLQRLQSELDALREAPTP